MRKKKEDKKVEVMKPIKKKDIKKEIYTEVI